MQKISYYKKGFKHLLLSLEEKREKKFVITEEVGGFTQSMIISYFPLPGGRKKKELGFDRDIGSGWDVSLVKAMEDHADTEFTFRRS